MQFELNITERALITMLLSKYLVELHELKEKMKKRKEDMKEFEEWHKDTLNLFGRMNKSLRNKKENKL